MARHPDWFERLDAIVDLTRQTPVECFGRQEMKAVFGCSERDSIRLLHKFGATEIADALSLPRASLVTQLEALRAGTAYSAFLRQRQQVAQHLAVAHAENIARSRRIPGSAQCKAGKSLADLPPGIRLEPGRIVCEFAYPEDFWAIIDALADIAAQDPDAFENAILAKVPL
jgi:hypothetical protein